MQCGFCGDSQLLPQLDHVDMDGPLLQTEDPAMGIEFDFGKVRILGREGLGIQMK